MGLWHEAVYSPWRAMGDGKRFKESWGYYVVALILAVR